MSLVSVCKNLFKAQGMALVLATSGLLLAGCGAGTADGTYTVEVESGADGTTGIVVTPPPAPTPTQPEQPAPRTLDLTSQPASAVVFEGQSQTFSLAYSNSHPVTVSWLKDGSPISGATGNSYTVGSASGASAGNYSCAVTDGTLTVNCASFALTVNQIVRITQQPSNQMLNEGIDASLTVTATGTGPINYQWYFNDQLLAGKTTAQLTLSAVTPSSQGQYHVVVSNAGSTVASASATLSVMANPVGKALLNWQAPNQRKDGSSLAASEIAGYQVYYASSATGELSELATVTGAETSLIVEELAQGNHYFALTTLDSSGSVSDLSSRFAVNIQ